MERLEKRMKKIPENQIVDKAINEIQALADSLDSVNINMLDMPVVEGKPDPRCRTPTVSVIRSPGPLRFFATYTRMKSGATVGKPG